MRSERGGAFARSLVRIGYRYPVRVLVGALLVVAAGLLAATRLTFDTDVLNLVPAKDPVVAEFKRVLEEFGSLETLLIAVPVASEERLDEALALVDALAAELELSPHLTRVQAHLEDPTRLAQAVLPHALLYLDEEGLAAVEQRLTPEGLRRRAADIRAAVESPQSIIAKDFLLRDPFGFLPLLLSRVARAPSLKVDVSSGYYLSSDHTMALVLAKPVGPAQDIDFDRELFDDLGARVERARAHVAEDLALDPGEVPEVLIGGGHRIALEDASLIRNDIGINSATSLLGVMVLFLLAYRRFATAQYAFAPLAVGLALTFGFAAVTIGHLSSATAGFAALLVGLGIDFTIVMYGRYLEERLAGASLEAALDAMAMHSGPAVILGAVTTVGTFFAFLLTRFRGLREFGLLTGTGIVLLALCTFLLLPALVAIFDRKSAPKPHPKLFDLGPLLAALARRRRLVLFAALVLTLLAAAALPFVHFEDDVRRLRSPSNRGVQIQDRVAAAFGLSFNGMMIRVEAATLEELVERVREIDLALDPLVERGLLSAYESIASLVPPIEQQQRNLRWLEERAALTDPARVRGAFAAALADAGLVPGAFTAGLDSLGATLRPSGPISVEVWQGTPVQELVDRSLRHEDGRYVTVINVFSPAGAWRREAPAELVGLIASFEGATLTGVNLVSQRLRRVVWVDAAIAGLVGLAVVFLMLLWEMRGVQRALLCLVPVVLGIVWTLGLMAAVGLSLNLLNVFVITMIIGVGSDYAIHILHRVGENGDASAVPETARAVVLAALTTVVGFGSLVTTHYPGLRSIGWMTAIGVVFSCLAAVAVLPLLIPTRRR